MTSRRAFTLVELLVAAALTAALAGGIIVVVRTVATTWTRAASRLDTASQARLAGLMKDHLAAGGLIVAATHGDLGLPARELRLGGAS